MRCRLVGFGSQPFCPKHTHVAAPPQPDPVEVASTLTANLDDFTSAAQINDFLSRLLLLPQDKISTRRAAVLAYITNQILRTLPVIAKEEDAKPTTIIADMPGPDTSALRQTKIRRSTPRPRPAMSTRRDPETNALGASL
jgi:hypothetical protein